MYSDMSTRISAAGRRRGTWPARGPARSCRRRWGREKMNEPIGRFGSLSPARERRMARDTALMASSWPTTERVQLVFHAQQPRGLGLLEPGDRECRSSGTR